MTDIDLIKKFIKIYSSAQISIDSNEKTQAEQKYTELLEVYNQIKNSSLDYSHKKIAFNQIQKVYKGINGIETRKNINKYAVFAAVLVILLSFAVVIKPTMFGLAILEKGLYGNSAPYWSSEQTRFELNGELELRLSSYFTDPDGDKLTFLTKHQKGLKLALADDLLTIINDRSYGEVPLELIATDGRIIARQTIMLDVN